MVKISFCHKEISSSIRNLSIDEHQMLSSIVNIILMVIVDESAVGWLIMVN